MKKTIGGFLATIDSPALAIHCASAIMEAGRGIGITLRAGLHAGGCELVGDDISGVAVQIAERVFERAAPGGVVVSTTVKDLVAGVGLRFEDLEIRHLTGPVAVWRLHRVVAGTSSSPGEACRE